MQMIISTRLRIPSTKLAVARPEFLNARGGGVGMGLVKCESLNQLNQLNRD
jgi:hypothetical protein